MAVLIDYKTFGRKNFLIGAFLLGGALLITAFGLDGKLFKNLIHFSRFFLLITIIIASQYTIEVYNTKIRGTGLGMASAVGSLGGILMP